MVTKTPAEMAEMRAEIAAGKLPADAFKQHFDAEERAVFGQDVKHDRQKNPIEQGIGAHGNETLNHFRALRLAEQAGHEEAGTYEAAVADIWKRNPERAKKIGLHQPKKAT